MTINARFDGGAAAGRFEKFETFQEFVVRNGQKYQAGYYEDGQPARTGNVVLIYQPEWTPEEQLRGPYEPEGEPPAEGSGSA